MSGPSCTRKSSEACPSVPGTGRLASLKSAFRYLEPNADAYTGFLMNAIQFSLLAVAYRDGKRKLADLPAG